jgi:hypothetical protein
VESNHRQPNDDREVDLYFDAIDASDHYREVALRLVQKYDEKGQERPYFASFREDAKKVGLDAGPIIELLRVNNYPILEKVNLYRLYVDKGRHLLKAAQEIKQECEEYLASDGQRKSRYAETYAHFGDDFIAQLHLECGKQRVPYAGLSTLIHLSQGVPRNLLMILRHIHRRSQFNGEQPFVSGRKISVQAQSEGVRDAAMWFWEDAQPDSYGPVVRRSIERLAELFNEIRFSSKPSECGVSCFIVGLTVGSAEAREVLDHAENWSYLIKVPGGGSDKNKASASHSKYQLNPMLCSRWQVSELRRGSIELNHEIFCAIFDPNIDADSAKKLISNRLHDMQNPLVAMANEIQHSLF